jgi:hypothetical protein
MRLVMGSHEQRQRSEVGGAAAAVQRRGAKVGERGRKGALD